MKRSKRILVLVIILAVACAATFAVNRYEEKQEEIQNSDAILLSVPTDSVTSLSWTDADGTLAFHRSEGSWLYDEDAAFPVSTEKISAILSHFESFGVSFIIENVEDYAQYGLDEPECTISLTAGDESHTIRLGSFSKLDAQRYVDIDDGCVYLVSDDPMDYLATELSAMIEDDTIPSWDSVTDLTFTGSADYAIKRIADSALSYSADDVYFAQLDGEKLPLDTALVEGYLDTIRQLAPDTYVTYHASEEELAAFGLDTPMLAVTVGYTQTDADENETTGTCTLYIGQNVEELAAYQDAVAADEDEAELPTVSKYVRIGQSQIVYPLSDADFDTLTAASYDDLRHSAVFWGDFDAIRQIDVTLEGKTHTLTQSQDAEASDEDAAAQTVWYYGEDEIDCTGLQSALASLEADSFTDELPDGQEELSLTLYLENDAFPQVAIQLYRYDGSLCLAVVDGEPVSFVPRADAMALVEAVQAIVLN